MTIVTIATVQYYLNFVLFPDKLKPAVSTFMKMRFFDDDDYMVIWWLYDHIMII